MPKPPTGVIPIGTESQASDFLVVSPEMTYKTGQMSVRSVFETLPDRYAEVDETWCVYIPWVWGHNF